MTLDPRQRDLPCCVEQTIWTMYIRDQMGFIWSQDTCAKCGHNYNLEYIGQTEEAYAINPDAPTEVDGSYEIDIIDVKLIRHTDKEKYLQKQLKRRINYG